jgi:hypothetical protein
MGAVEVFHDWQLVPRIQFGNAGIAAVAFAKPDSVLVIVR